jgi:hypothetical protein
MGDDAEVLDGDAKEEQNMSNTELEVSLFPLEYAIACGALKSIFLFVCLSLIRSG